MIKCQLTVFLCLALSIQQIYSTKETEKVEETTKPLLETLDPSQNQMQIKSKFDRDGSDIYQTSGTLARVKRQYYPYYRYPVPVPIFIGGGGWYGGRGFGGRGFGGRGFGGRGFGGRGFGGFGGRGGFGGGRGGRG